MKAFALIFNDGRDVEQDFLNQLEVTTFIRNWLYVRPVVFIISDQNVHFLAEAIRHYDLSRWFFITEIVMGTNNGLQPNDVWNFINDPQAKDAAGSNWISQLVASMPKTPEEPKPGVKTRARALPPPPGPRKLDPPTPTIPGRARNPLSEALKDKK